MKHPSEISDEQLNALLDGELDSPEKDQLLTELTNDPELRNRYEALQRTKQLLVQAYTELPQAIPDPVYPNHFTRPLMGVAASVILLIGIAAGWLLGADIATDPQSNIQSIAQINAITTDRNKILLHISTAEDTQVNKLLAKATILLLSAQQKEVPLKLEIVANADGLQILRKNSPYREKIHALSNRFKNVKFLACGIAKKTAALKEGKPIELLPEAEDIPAALDRILGRLKEGWLYVGRE